MATVSLSYTTSGRVESGLCIESTTSAVTTSTTHLGTMSPFLASSVRSNLVLCRRSWTAVVCESW